MMEKVKTTWLEITSPDEANFKEDFTGIMEIREVENDMYINFMLFAGVGLPWRWYSRLNWTLPDWEDYFSRVRAKTFLGFAEGRIAGYYEIVFDDKNDAEIKFFGLLPSQMDKGLGGVLLSHAIKSSFDNGASRIWLHTCTGDSEAALGNYLSRGFRIYKEEEAYEDVPGKDELVSMISRFFSSYYDHFRRKAGN